MNTTAAVVSVIFVAGALVLAWRGLQAHELPRGQVLKMAGIWAAMIVGLTLVLALLGAR